MAVILRTAAQLTGAASPDPGFTSLWWLPGTTGGSTADATDCLDRFSDFWISAASAVDDAYTVDFDPICIAVEATTGVLVGAFAGTDPASVVGTATGDPLPRQTQGMIRLGTSTVVSGRRLQGRLYVPGPVEGSNSINGVPEAAYVTDITTAAGTLLNPGATASDPVIWHRPTGGAGGSHGIITSVAGSTTWAVLRSRR
jgi:hypothetical protein